MKKQVDFSKGTRGRYAGKEFVVIGSGEQNQPDCFAVCITDKDKSFTPMKIYKITLNAEKNIVIVKDDNNEASICPANYFSPITLPTDVTGFLAKQLHFA
jgi:hypothetical protein